MTREEAVKILEVAKAEVEWNCPLDYQIALDMAIEALQQSEMVLCKDCKHFVRDDVEEYTEYGFYNTYFHAFCDKHWDKEKGEHIDVCLDDFCSFAERRADE